MEFECHKSLRLTSDSEEKIASSIIWYQPMGGDAQRLRR